MREASSAAQVPCVWPLGLLMRVKFRALRNRLVVALSESPLRVLVTVVLVLLIWYGLYFLFFQVLDQFKRTPLEATVAIPLVFSFFFVAMLALLTLSNALIAYGMLFGRSDSTYLLVAPLRPKDVVKLKYIESLVMSSWSLFVLGLPLMMALARSAREPIFYPLFIAFFVAFIPIPGALGMLLAWFAARFFSRDVITTAAALTAGLVAALIVWGLAMLRLWESASEEWLRAFLTRMSFVEATLLPNNWVARGIDHALRNELGEALGYLFVTTANALFLSWITVRLVARYLMTAYDRSSAGRARELRRPARTAGGSAAIVFAYLPLGMRLIAAKDLRTFLRDPLQWGQLAILFGLMALYLTNMPSLHLEFIGSGWQLILPFLNLCAISLILATFTCRFVFPLVSLEGQKLWLLGLLPVPRAHILWAKFAFAMTVTMLVAVGATLLAAARLDLGIFWTAIHVAVVVVVCFGLCGFSVGLGARLPMFHQTNVARIANGLGGTTNLLASIALITVILAGVGAATWRVRFRDPAEIPDTTTLSYCGAALLLGVVCGSIVLWIGARHLERVEV